MEPIPESVELAHEMGRYLDPGVDLIEHLRDLADKVQTLVPDCVGLSLAWLDRGVAFTLVASNEEIAVLDAVQYLAGGPCVDAVEIGTGLSSSAADPLDEDTWQLFAQARAARAVRSTLSIPLVHNGAVVGTANLYAASDRAFDQGHEQLARLLGGSATDIVRNADLSFRTRARAEGSRSDLRSADLVDNAVGVLVAALGLDPATASERLGAAAQRSGISSGQLAGAIVALLTRPSS